MEKVIINSYEEFEKLVGQQIGVPIMWNSLRNISTFLQTQHWTTSGFTLTQNGQK